MTTPFWSRDRAIQEANCLADAIRRHGACAEVNVEVADPSELHERIRDLNAVLPGSPREGRQGRPVT